MAVTPLGTAGAVFELAELIAELSSQGAPPSSRAVVVLPLRRGTAAQARELVEADPPFELEQTGLERHYVFVTEREVVFLFEGENARETLERLIRSPLVLKQAASWRRCLAGRPLLADEGYTWSRER